MSYFFICWPTNFIGIKIRLTSGKGLLVEDAKMHLKKQINTSDFEKQQYSLGNKNLEHYMCNNIDQQYIPFYVVISISLFEKMDAYQSIPSYIFSIAIFFLNFENICRHFT